MNKQAKHPLTYYAQATGLAPGLFPRGVAGPATHAAVMTGGGAVAGRYLAPWLLRRFVPGVNEHRAGIVGAIGGGLAGMLLATPSLIGKYGPDATPAPSQYTFPSSTKASMWGVPDPWTQPTTPPALVTDVTRQALYSGQMDPIGALYVQQAANQQKSPTPASFGAALANTLFGAGAGFLPAYAVGRAGAGILGALGVVNDAQQTRLATGTGLMGALAGVILGATR